MLLYVHLSIGVQWNLDCIMTIHVYLVYLYESKSLVRMAMLSNSGLR
jgi:hypothetical protein